MTSVILAAETIGQIATLVTICAYLSGLTLIRTIIRNQDSDGVDFLPLIVGWLCGYAWLLFGFAVPDRNVIAVNAFGLVISTLIVGVHLAFNGEMPRFYRDMALTCGALLTAYALYVLTLSSSIIGTVGLTLQVLYYVAPLLSLAEVIQNKDSTPFPKAVIFMALCSASMWMLYGFLVGETLIVIPNAIGLVLSGLQFTFCIKYPPKRHRS